MKPVPLAGFRIGHSQARGIAEALWGKGGTNSERCNRPGAFYFSCSGHGGYVVDASILTEQERAKIEEVRSPEPVKILVQGNRVIGVSNPFTGSRSFRYNSAFGTPEWRAHPVFLFEEDCDWSILEHLTDIRSAWSLKKQREDPEKHSEEVSRMFEQVLEYKRQREERAKVDAIPQT